MELRLVDDLTAFRRRRKDHVLRVVVSVVVVFNACVRVGPGSVIGLGSFFGVEGERIGENLTRGSVRLESPSGEMARV